MTDYFDDDAARYADPRFGAGPGRDAVPRRRPRRTGRRWLIAIAVVIVLLVVIDRVGVLVADQAVATRAQSSQHLEHKPAVSITGFPFLTQAIGNHYRKITLSGSDVTVGAGDQRVKLQSFHGTLTGVRTIDNFSGVTAEHVSGTADLGYSELSRVLGVQLSYANGGRIQASKSVTVAGQTVRGTVSAVVTVPGGDQLAFSDVRVAVQGIGVGVPAVVTSQLSSIFDRKLSLDGLPFGLRITQLSVVPSGIEVSAAADNVRAQ